MDPLSDIDILMITYNRPEYTRRSLTRLLETCDHTMRVWLWHNGTDHATLNVVRSLADHARIHRVHYSAENKKLCEPTNWLWREATGQLIGKVDDDCLMPDGWASTLRNGHRDISRLGVVSCWPYREADFVPEIAMKKIEMYPGGHRILRNRWVGGSGYLMKRACFEELGALQPNGSFSDYCRRLASKGWINGWYYPFIYQDHMDDPRSPNTLLKTDADMKACLPLSARTFGVRTLAAWERALRKDARKVQESPLDPPSYSKWQRRRHRLISSVRRLLCAALPRPR
jgi:GT2 family glycosyltransferase